MADFVHLHLHTQFSLLDGAIRLNDLAQKCKALAMPAVAITDHGNMFGAVSFYKTMRKAELKPLLGCEAYVAGPKGHKDRSERVSHHLVLLARTTEGFKNLIYLISQAYLEGFYYNARIDKELLAQRSKGLIGLSACLAGEVPQALMARDMEKARNVAGQYRDIFEKGCYYLEVQDNGLAEQKVVNEGLERIASDLALPLVATNDCHYLERADARAHEILMCIQTGKTLLESNRLRHEGDPYYVKSPQEMIHAFRHLPHAIRSTMEVAQACDVTIDLGNIYLPQYKVPEGHTLESYLREKSLEGLVRRFQEAGQRGQALEEGVYRERLDRELEIISSMGFAGYFLIVWDFIRYSKEAGIPVGPGRGSGAGSVVAYSLAITDIDPIRYGLLFERFLNPERVSMPDFDIDFCQNRRDEVIKYVTQKYGNLNVGQIITFGTLRARAVIRDVGRVMGLTFAETDRIAKLVPEGPGVTLEQALDTEPRLREMQAKEEVVREVLTVARSLEGLHRHAGTHAAGVVIADNELYNYVPLFKGSNGEIVTQYAKDEVEEAGLVKFDFLGLKTLTMIDDALRIIHKRQPDFDLRAIAMDDRETFALLSSGDTVGVFQLESSGFKELMRKLKPDTFEDIIAAVALYRPGPLGSGMVDDFVHRKHGEVAVSYPHPWLQEILKETYGVIVYQEQVMQIASRLAGFTLGQADLLRRAMGKKKPEVMAQQKEIFVQGALAKEVDQKAAAEIFDLMAYFAGYGFNKSHSAAYALISYQTAYLKAHSPLAFMAALLTSEAENTVKLVRYMAETRSMGVEILPPDVNESERSFTAVEGRIRVGMGAIKGVGDAAMESIMAEREKDGFFRGLYDFCDRVDLRKVNRRVVEALIRCGAFDQTGFDRARLMGAVDRALERGQARQRDRLSGQISMFDVLSPAPQAPGAQEEDYPDEQYPEVERWSEKERLAHEKEALGFYVTGHPLDRFAGELKRFATVDTETLEQARDAQEVAIGGVVADIRERVAKDGKGRHAFITLEDLQGQVEVCVFNKVYSEFGDLVRSDEPILVRGRVSAETSGETKVVKVISEKVESLSELIRTRTRVVHIHLRVQGSESAKLRDLARALDLNRGAVPVSLHIHLPDLGEAVLALPDRWRVEPREELVQDLDRLLGPGSVQFH